VGQTIDAARVGRANENGTGDIESGVFVFDVGGDGTRPGDGARRLRQARKIGFGLPSAVEGGGRWQACRVRRLDVGIVADRRGKEFEGAHVIVDPHANLMHVVLTTDARRRRAHLLNGGDKKANEDGNDGNHHQQLDQCEPASLTFSDH
jgi:hypothetical protein